MVGKDHGRIEIRRCWTTGGPALLAHADPDREWCDLTSLVWVESERCCGDRVTTDLRIFISSLLPKARLQLQAMRRHWSIENAHHWVMDVAFSEDGSRIRTGHAVHNMTILKRIAHNLVCWLLTGRDRPSCNPGPASRDRAAARGHALPSQALLAGPVAAPVLP